MSKLREAAAMLVTQGKVLGHLEACKTSLQQFERLYQLAQRAREQGVDVVTMVHRADEVLSKLVAEQQAAVSSLERLAETAQRRAEDLVAEVEHPGAVLARRLVASARAARAAWRAH